MRAAAAFVVVLAACRGPVDAPPAPVATPVVPTAPAAAASSGVTPSKPLVEGATLRPHHEENVVECPAVLSGVADDEARVALRLEEANC